MMTYIVVARQIGPPRFLRSSRSLLPKCSSADDDKDESAQRMIPPTLSGQPFTLQDRYHHMQRLAVHNRMFVFASYMFL